MKTTWEAVSHARWCMNMGLRVALAAGLTGVAITITAAETQEGEQTMKASLQEVQVTMKGNPVTLMGTPVKKGDPAPDFTVVDATFKPLKLSDHKGQVAADQAVQRGSGPPAHERDRPDH